MFLPLTMALAVATAVAAQSDSRPKFGAVLLQGALDIPLEPVGREFLIPKGRCSGQITPDQYFCLFLVSLNVTAKSYNPVKIEITENFEAVNIYGCGPVYVTLAHGCEFFKHDAPPARAVPASRPARAIAVLHPVPGYKELK